MRFPCDRPARGAEIHAAEIAMEAPRASRDFLEAAFNVTCVVGFREATKGHGVPVAAEGQLVAVRRGVWVMRAS